MNTRNKISFIEKYWFAISAGIIILCMVIVIIILLLQSPKKKTSLQTSKCYDNVERYITDVIVYDSSDNEAKCPDGYFDAYNDKDMVRSIKINKKSIDNKLCYKIPLQICETDSIITDLNINSKSKETFKCTPSPGYDCTANSTVKCYSSSKSDKAITLPEILCRCKKCGDIPVGYINSDDNEQVINCAGILKDGDNPQNIMCMSQELYNPNQKGGINNIYLTKDTCKTNYTNIKNSNICISKK